MHFLPLFRQFLVFSSLSGAVLVVHGVPLVSRQGSHVFVRAAETIVRALFLLDTAIPNSFN